MAAAIVPFAIIVHLTAEAVAVGRGGLDATFVLRHSYFGGLMAACIAWFASTAGLGRPSVERRRRCALLRADLDCRRPHDLLLLVAANVAFFALSEGLEGFPLMSGTLVLGLGVAMLGSLLAAWLVFAFGHALAAAGLDSIIGVAPVGGCARALSRRDRGEGATQRVTTVYNLFVPNRPPPFASPV